MANLTSIVLARLTEIAKQTQPDELVTIQASYLSALLDSHLHLTALQEQEGAIAVPPPRYRARRKPLDTWDVLGGDFDERSFMPGTYGCHEALHMAALFADWLDDFSKHPAILLHEEWAAKAEAIAQRMAGLYQAIGKEHLNMPNPEDETNA